MDTDTDMCLFPQMPFLWWLISRKYMHTCVLGHVWVFATPWTVARQAPLLMGFSRQEYWSRLPCSPPGDHLNSGIDPRLLHCRQILYHLSHQFSSVQFSSSVVSDLCDPMDCSLPGSSVHRIFQARILEWVAISSSRGSSWPRDRTCISCIAGKFFPAEPPGKPLMKIKCLICFVCFWFLNAF